MDLSAYGYPWSIPRDPMYPTIQLFDERGLFLVNRSISCRFLIEERPWVIV